MSLPEWVVPAIERVMEAAPKHLEGVHLVPTGSPLDEAIEDFITRGKNASASEWDITLDFLAATFHVIQEVTGPAEIIEGLMEVDMREAMGKSE